MKLKFALLLMTAATANSANAMESVNLTKECPGSRELVVPTSERAVAENIRIDYINIVHRDDPCGQSLNLEGISELTRKVNEAVASTMAGTKSKFKFIIQYMITQTDPVKFDFGVDGDASSDKDRLDSLYRATYQFPPNISGNGKIYVSFEYSASPSD